MVELPSGTVTFLFTDIEGSTALWEHQPEAMRAALARHDLLIRAVIGEHGGHVFKTIGDAFCAAFTSAPDAVAAAAEAQRRLQAEPWGDIDPLRVRMALHTGMTEERDGDYFGPPLNRVARLLSAGHGGQVLLSRATYELVRDVPLEGTGLVDRGEHRLKDLIRPERVFQLTGPDLPTELLPLATLDARPNNLPLQSTPLLGREREVAAARERLLSDDVRLLTLTGPGGTGKTRLSLQVAAELIDQFADGVFFVALAPIADPLLVPATIAQALGIRDVGGRPVSEGLKEYLRNRTLLLVLDNLEQILPAAPFVGELLGVSPKLKILATSRAPLELRGEHELPVPPLALPDPRRLPSIAALSQYAAVALFVARAVAIRPDFAVTNDNAPAVAEICVRLDGLPLAIELAAARIRLLSPQAMLARLERRLPLLTGGARDLPARQQTLRGAIAWSYDLLDEGERALFRRLAIFVGGCTLEAAAVCNPAGELGLDVLDGVASLVAKSLLRREEEPEDEPRFGMLETIREYGLEQLEASGEADAARRAHAAYFLALTEEAAPQLLGREQVAWLRRLDPEHDNLRAVLARSRTGEIAAEVGLRVAARLHWFWGLRGFVGEGRGWMEAMLALPGAAGRTVTKAWVLHGAAHLAIWDGDYAAARPLAQESTAIFREVGDLQGAGRSLILQGLGVMGERSYATARSLFAESTTIAREVGDRWSLAFAANPLGAVAQNEGDYGAARAFREESAAIAREIGDRFTLGLALAGLALLARQQTNYEESAARFKEALLVSSELDEPVVVLRSLAGLASLARLDADYDRSARLFGTVEALREASGVREMPLWRDLFERDVADVNAALGDQAFAAAWAAGRAMSLAQAVTYALGEVSFA
jgi:predicted ATPase/class 3 adenylate cyclase